MYARAARAAECSPEAWVITCGRPAYWGRDRVLRTRHCTRRARWCCGSHDGGRGSCAWSGRDPATCVAQPAPGSAAERVGGGAWCNAPALWYQLAVVSTFCWSTRTHSNRRPRGCARRSPAHPFSDFLGGSAVRAPSLRHMLPLTVIFYATGSSSSSRRFCCPSACPPLKGVLGLSHWNMT